ncbi:MAG: SH3 domain-containing protein [Acidobacteria bacterium]|nr:SH3 domain-containing protein [Acidobacteriota bacterium]
MPRIIEYGDRDYVANPGSGYGGTAAIAVLILFLLYLGGFFPWILNQVSSRPIVQAPIVQPPIETVPNTSIVPPITTAPMGAVGYVTADNLNMRMAPGQQSQAIYILPRGVRVEYLGESYQEPDGDFWVQVRVQTNEGPQVGWVSRRYIS